MSKKTHRILSLDIGGTFTKIALCLCSNSLTIDVQKEGKFKTDRFETWGTVWKKVLNYCDTNEIDINIIDALSIAVPGFPDEKNMTLKGGSPNLPELAKSSLKETLEVMKFNKPVFMVNDATAQMYFEHRNGILRNAKNALLLTVGTGIGGGILINGKVYEGCMSGAGEFGHIALHFNGLTEIEQCSCGKINCIERYASVSGLLRSVYSLYHMSFEKAEDVLDAFCKEQSFFSSVDLWLEAISSLAGSLVNIFNPESICFSGTIMKYKELLPHLKKKINQYGFKTLTECLDIVLSSDSKYAGVKGSVVYAIENMNLA